MEGLRWILLVIGLLILGGIYYFGSASGRARLPGRARRERDPSLDPEMERELERLGALINDERRRGKSEDLGMDEQDQPAALAAEPERIVALYLRCRGAGLIDGREIAEAAEKAGLDFGPGGIYHRLQERDEQRVAIFSLANITNPGSFDAEHPERTQTQGLCLFLTLPNQLSALDAWDAMLAAGRRLADLLDVELLDETQSSLSRQRVAHIREQMRDFDRRHEIHVPGA